MKKVMPTLQVVMVAGLCCMLAACTSLQSQMNSFDEDMRSCVRVGQWHSAYKVVAGAQFGCEPHEEPQIEEWRKAEIVQLKALFSKFIQPTVNEANSYYSKGDLDNGDKVRQGLRAKYFGGEVNDETTGILPQWVAGENAESGIPECLTPCLELALAQMLSDRNIARMIAEFNGFQKRISVIDVNGGKKSIKEFDEIFNDFKKVEKWKDEIAQFMEMLAVPETRKWAPLDRSQYAGAIERMEKVRDDVLKQYKTRRWNTRVIDRKHDYEKIARLSAERNYYAARQILDSHDDWLVKPIGLPDAMEFDDPAERSKVASGDLGEAIIKQIFESSDRRSVYERRTSNRGTYSMLVVSRVYVEDVKNQRELHNAQRTADLLAHGKLAKYLETLVSDEAASSAMIKDDDFHKTFKESTRTTAQAKVANLTFIAEGIYGNEYVYILGWRNPDAGNITPAPMRRVSGFENFILSPSVGAFL